MKILISLLLLIVVLSSCRQGPTHGPKFLWKPYSKQAIADSIANQRPVVIDFWAEWCPNCHDLDRTVFSLPQIQAKLYQVTALRMDVTNQDDPDVQKVIQDYQVDGVPTVVFLDRKGKEIDNSRVIGLVTPQEFSQALALLTIFK